MRLACVFMKVADQGVVPEILTEQQIDEIVAIGERADEEEWQQEGLAIVTEVAPSQVTS